MAFEFLFVALETERGEAAMVSPLVFGKTMWVFPITSGSG